MSTERKRTVLRYKKSYLKFWVIYFNQDNKFYRQGCAVEENSSEVEAFKEESRARAEASSGSQMNEYEAKMLEAFVGKPDSPDKGLWYANAFSKYDINGVDVMRWKWSWWAFFGGIWFLIYRKAYAAAGGLFLISIVASFIPFSGIVISILAGGFSTYFVYRIYKTKKLEIERANSDESQRIEMMRVVGGYNAWAAWVFPILIVIGILAAIAVPQLAETDGMQQQMNEQKIQELEMQFQQSLEQTGQ